MCSAAIRVVAILVAEQKGAVSLFHEFLPGSELFLIPGARHFVQLDEPEQVARLILAMPGPRSTPA
jgi:pimeloyl-ACP methyl ester carboxylesterase